MSPDEARHARASSLGIAVFAALAIIARLRTARPALPVTILAAMLVAAAAAGGCLGWGWTHGAAAPAPATAAVAAIDEPKEAAPPRPVDTRLDVPAAPAPARAPAPSRATPETLSARIDRLARSPDPVDAFAAYRLATGCLWARDHEAWMATHVSPGDRALLPTTQSACGDIASDQIQSRLRWLERAALAGVHHAATEMAREGPDGLGLATPAQDAGFEQRLQAAYEAGVHTCDPESLENRESAYENGAGVEPDRARALAYWVAYRDCRRRLADTPGGILGDADSITRRMGATLSADEIATAVGTGQQMARDARPLPGDD